jgi:hypothetical protein
MDWFWLNYLVNFSDNIPLWGAPKGKNPISWAKHFHIRWVAVIENFDLLFSKLP